jgi:hypothetical protein
VVGGGDEGVETCSLLGGADVVNGQGEKFLVGITVGLAGGAVNGEEAQGFFVAHPDGKRV